MDCYYGGDFTFGEAHVTWSGHKHRYVNVEIMHWKMQIDTSLMLTF